MQTGTKAKFLPEPSHCLDPDVVLGEARTRMFCVIPMTTSLLSTLWAVVTLELSLVLALAGLPTGMYWVTTKKVKPRN